METPPAENTAIEPVQPGPYTLLLQQQNLSAEFLGYGQDKVEMISVAPQDLLQVAKALREAGFNYLRLQCGYDEGAGERFVSVYQLTQVGDNLRTPPEVRLKVFLPRDNPRVPSVYWLWKAADWQERESFDMFGIVYEGHPNLIRILSQEDVMGWPLRKDYVTPDLYELQDAY